MFLDSDFADASSTSLCETLPACDCWRLLLTHCATAVQENASYLATVADLYLPCYSVWFYGRYESAKAFAKSVTNMTCAL